MRLLERMQNQLARKNKYHFIQECANKSPLKSIGKRGMRSLFLYLR